jgi:diguanylate cyclase (GGDEF)-like protein
MEHSYPVLIVEDDPVSREVLRGSLSKAGWEKILCAENGREAFDILKKDFIPIVIADWVMPEMNGLELCSAIRNHNFPGYVFIILLTARDSREDIVAGLKAGADDYLTKPFNPAELIARLNSAKRILELERSLRESKEEIRILSITDPLTRVYNRLYLNDRLPGEIRRAERYSRPLSLMMCDIDDFKTVNDLYGHQGGDSVLKEFADCIKRSIRKGIDWIARYGGEEFIIVLPETCPCLACKIAERLRSEVSKIVLKVKGDDVMVTASFGVSGMDMSAESRAATADTLIGRADEFLYQAKKEGKNTVRGGRLRDCT